jgi:hypothetical protein
MIKLQILKSDNPKKKYKAIFTKNDGKTKTIHFGASGYQDYLQSHDKNQRNRYRQRHEKDLKTNDAMRAGYLSYYILWGDSTNLTTNIASFKKKYGFI